MKVLLILSDGVRSDSLQGLDAVEMLKKHSTYCMEASTVMPSITLPCHLSLFLSVDPSRHGTTTNTYAPQVRPVPGLFEQINNANKKSAMFYNWGELRDLSRPCDLSYAEYMSCSKLGSEETTRSLCVHAIDYLNQNDVDFSFLYLGWTDTIGHKYGWMSEEYLSAVKETCGMIEKVIRSLPEDYAVIITSDHGGHDRTHGLDIKEDMTIPVFLYGKPFEKDKEIKDVNIKDIAPTIAGLLKVECSEDWDGKPIKF